MVVTHIVQMALQTIRKPVQLEGKAMEPWREKANRVIAELCAESYRAANYVKGAKRKRHIPYSVPTIAQALVECLATGDEIGAKSIFLRLACGTICDQTI
jgi:hypothetical protein